MPSHLFSPHTLPKPISRRRALALGGAAAMAPGLIRPGFNALAQDNQVEGAEYLLPNYRLLLYYGYPGNENMGILGEFDKDEVLEKLKEQAAAYEEADPDRPVKVGFELIASVAQGDPGEDGLYIADAPGTILTEYSDFCAENDILLFFDVQMGFRTPYEDYIGLERWLLAPHVHLAIDPEFAMREGEIPGEYFGQVTGEQVTEAQNYLAKLAADNGLPPKVLIVHQFRLDMIEQKDEIAPVDGVQLVIDEDGVGSPDMKAETYEVVITQDPIEFNGIKLFYQHDDPLMTPEEVLAFEPAPDVIIYQ